MNIRLLCIGKTDDERIQSLISEYETRLKHYVNFKAEILQVRTKPRTPELQKKEEGNLILKNIDKSTYLILMDEAGRLKSSQQFAGFLQKRMNSGLKEIVFIIGGAYGFSDEVYARTNTKLALSNMTFTHQMVRLIFIEQLYRACTILKGEKYHH